MKKLIQKVLIRLGITSLTPHHFGGLTYCLWLCERYMKVFLHLLIIAAEDVLPWI